MEAISKEERPSVTNVEEWNVDQVAEWLEARGFFNCVLEFRRNAIDGYVLLRLSEEDLRREPLSLSRLGDIKRIAAAIKDMVLLNNFNVQANAAVNTASLRNHSLARTQSLHSEYSYSVASGFVRRVYSTHLKPEKFKALVAATYAAVVLYVTFLTTIIVNERVPDVKIYPPLPDLFLDNIPFIPWAFRAAEYICLTLFLFFCLVTITHRHRFIIMRRFCSLAGTLYLLRSICMLITSLSVPNKAYECRRYVDADIFSKLWRAWEIMLVGGMAVNGNRYCGDYMFSGHTTLLTLLSLFIDEYSDKNHPIFKLISWVLTLFGIFLVMAGHEHYSIDVFIAFYLTTRLFLYYHTLADNKAQLRYDERKVRIWFPLFSYFESGINGSVPHEYDWPITLPDFLSWRLFANYREHSA